MPSSFGTNASVTCILIVSVTGQKFIRVPSLPTATDIDHCPICLKAKLHKATSLPLLPAKLLNKDFYRLCFCRVTLQRQRAFAVSATCMAKRTRILGHSSYMLCKQLFAPGSSVGEATKWLATRHRTRGRFRVDLLRRQGSQSSRRLPTRPIE
jgi:hypothetical protein